MKEQISLAQNISETINKIKTDENKLKVYK